MTDNLVPMGKPRELVLLELKYFTLRRLDTVSRQDRVPFLREGIELLHALLAQEISRKRNV